MTTGEREALLPCPFCGSTNIDAEYWTSQRSDGTGKKSGPGCMHCGAEAADVVTWNTRALTHRQSESEEGVVKKLSDAIMNAIWVQKGCPPLYRDDTLGGSNRFMEIDIDAVASSSVGALRNAGHLSNSSGHHAFLNQQDSSADAQSEEPTTKAPITQQEIRTLMEGERRVENKGRPEGERRASDRD